MKNALPNYISLIMAGGSGTRFWPTSTPALPKQYLKLFGDRSLIQQTVDRLLPLQNPKDIFICSGKSQQGLLKEQLPNILHLILEPVPRNTAPCLMLSVRHLLEKGFKEDTVMGVFPADHLIPNGDAFQRALKTAVSFASTHPALITLGIAPTSPHTGYGYIEASQKSLSNVVKANQFVEKPDLEKAKAYLKSNTYYWNAGIFVWSLGTIKRAFEEYLTEDWKKISLAKSEAELDLVFRSLRSQPIDTALLEKADNVYVLGTTDLGWNDVGSWNAIYELNSKAGEVVTISGKTESVESSGCLVNVSQNHLVALVGVQDLIVVESGNRLLIMARDKDQLVKNVSEKHPV